MADRRDDVLYPLEVIISHETQREVTIVCSKTKTQMVDLQNHDLRNYMDRISRTYNRETKTISIRVPIPVAGGQDRLYGTDISIPGHGEIDVDATLGNDIQTQRDSFRFRVFKKNNFDMRQAAMK